MLAVSNSQKMRKEQLDNDLKLNCSFFAVFGFLYSNIMNFVIVSACFALLASPVVAQNGNSKHCGGTQRMKKRPKYYYYYEWMKKRIRDRHPEIAEVVMDKLLALDAGELDLLLQYPQAIDATVHELEGVLEERGEEELERFEVPLLSWGDMQRLKLKDVATVKGGGAPAALEGAA